MALDAPILTRSRRIIAELQRLQEFQKRLQLPLGPVLPQEPTQRVPGRAPAPPPGQGPLLGPSLFQCVCR